MRSPPRHRGERARRRPGLTFRDEGLHPAGPSGGLRSSNPWDWFLALTGPSTGEMIQMRYVVDPVGRDAPGGHRHRAPSSTSTPPGTCPTTAGTGASSRTSTSSSSRCSTHPRRQPRAAVFLVGASASRLPAHRFLYTTATHASPGQASSSNRIGETPRSGWACVHHRIVEGRHLPLRRPPRGTSRSATLLDGPLRAPGLGSFVLDALPLLGRWAWLGALAGGLNPTYGGLALLLFIGACGKARSSLLYVPPTRWRAPRPCPRSSTRPRWSPGVYLLCRLSFFYVRFTSVLNVVASSAPSPRSSPPPSPSPRSELKKVLAYSTVSQLGFHVHRLRRGFRGLPSSPRLLVPQACAVSSATAPSPAPSQVGHRLSDDPHRRAGIMGASFFEGRDPFRAFAHGWALVPASSSTRWASPPRPSSFTCAGSSSSPSLDGDEPKFLARSTSTARRTATTTTRPALSEHNGLDMKLMTTLPRAWVACASSSARHLPHGWTHRLRGILPAFQEHAIAGQLPPPEATRHRLHGKGEPAMVGGVHGLAGMALRGGSRTCREGRARPQGSRGAPGLYQPRVRQVAQSTSSTTGAIVRPVRGLLANVVAIFDRFFIDLIVNLVGRDRDARRLPPPAPRRRGVGLGALSASAPLRSSPR